MKGLSPDMKALLHRTVDGACYTLEERVTLLADLHRGTAPVFRASGGAFIGTRPLRAAGYMRHSHRDTRTDAGFGRRFEKFHRFAGRHLLALTTVYADLDTTGRAWIERPGFLELLLDARAGHFDVLLIEDPCHLARGAFAVLGVGILGSLGIPVVEPGSGASTRPGPSCSPRSSRRSRRAGGALRTGRQTRRRRGYRVDAACHLNR